jgi:hypothetical protein
VPDGASALRGLGAVDVLPLSGQIADAADAGKCNTALNCGYGQRKVRMTDDAV